MCGGQVAGMCVQGGREGELNEEQKEPASNSLGTGHISQEIPQLLLHCLCHTRVPGGGEEWVARLAKVWPTPWERLEPPGQMIVMACSS